MECPRTVHDREKRFFVDPAAGEPGDDALIPNPVFHRASEFLLLRNAVLEMQMVFTRVRDEYTTNREKQYDALQPSFGGIPQTGRSASPFRVGYPAWNVGSDGGCGRSEGP
jgi:hypothetical protein